MYATISLRNRPAIFRNLAAASRWAAGSAKPAAVVLGLPGEFVVVCMADFSRLLRAGFEAA